MTFEEFETTCKKFLKKEVTYELKIPFGVIIHHPNGEYETISSMEYRRRISSHEVYSIDDINDMIRRNIMSRLKTRYPDATDIEVIIPIKKREG